MFPNNPNPWDPNHPYWQNNEQEDRYRRDSRTGEVGYYPNATNNPNFSSSHHSTDGQFFWVLFSTPVFSLKHTPTHSSKHTPNPIHTRNPKHNPDRICSRNPSRTLF
ncbi:hypothetical protein Hanom_Chr10g00908741 [Helianthus anomalus]